MPGKEVIASALRRRIARSVKLGQAVSVGDCVFVIESMKLEIPVESEEGGKVVELLVSAGDDVQEGQRLAILV